MCHTNIAFLGGVEIVAGADRSSGARDETFLGLRVVVEDVPVAELVEIGALVGATWAEKFGEVIVKADFGAPVLRDRVSVAVLFECLGNDCLQLGDQRCRSSRSAR